MCDIQRGDRLADERQFARNGEVVGDGVQFAGHHHRCHQQAKHDVFALELQPREGERREHGHDQGQYRGYRSHQQRVQEQVFKVCLAERGGKVLEEQFVRPQRGHVGAVFLHRLQGRNDHPVEGEDYDQRHHSQEQVSDQIAYDFKYFLPAGGGSDVELIRNVQRAGLGSVVDNGFIIVISHGGTSIVNSSLADQAVDRRDNENYSEQYQRSGGGNTGLPVRQHLVHETDDGVHLSFAAGGAHGLAEYTYDAGVFFESADEGGDDHVRQHGGYERDGDPEEGADLGGAVDLGGFVVLLVDVLQTAQQHQDLERQRVPDDVRAYHEHVGAPAGTDVDKIDRIGAEQADEAVDDRLGLYQVADGNAVEHHFEDHADGNGVGDVRQEEYGLEHPLQRLDRVERHRDQQRQRRGDRHRDDAEQHRVFEALLEVNEVDDGLEVAETDLIRGGEAVGSVAVQQRHAEGIDQRVKGEYQQQYQRGRQIDPGFVLVAVSDVAAGIDPVHDVAVLRRRGRVAVHQLQDFIVR